VSVRQFAGLSLIALGIVVITKSTDYSGFIRVPVNPVGIALNAVGAFVFASGFFGCCSVRRTHFCAVVTVCARLAYSVSDNFTPFLFPKVCWTLFFKD